MRTMVVTGANGFLGRFVSRLAAQRGDYVVGIGHGDWQEESWRSWGLSDWHELDAGLATLVTHAGTPDMLIHCAGSSSVGFSMENPAQDFERTVGTTVQVLEFLRTCSPDTILVYPSSGAVYGRAERLPTSEDSLLTPISPYGVHKKIAEDLCRSYGASFGVRVSIVRIFSAYGVGLRKQLLWDACRKAISGDCQFGGTGLETRDWVNAEDVARLLMIAGEHASASATVVNCASGLEVTVASIVGAVFEELGAAGKPEFSGLARAGDPERVAGDPARAMSLGWTPERAWREGVREYAQWFREAFP